MDKNTKGGKELKPGISRKELQSLNQELHTLNAELRDKMDFLDSLLNNAGAPIVVWDAALKIIRFNRAFERLTGKTIAEMLGKQVDILVPPDKRDGLLREINRAALTGQGWEGSEVAIQCADGSVRIILWSAAMLFAADGKTPVATIAQGQDISERKKVEQLKDDFIGMVSHELRTPLTIIASAINTALDERISPQEQRELLKAADASAESLGSILDNLLELARYRMERLTLEKKLAGILEIASKTVAKVRRQYPGRKVMLDISGDLPPALIDPTRLERIISNLVENAFKYSTKGSEVRVFARPEQAELLIGVSDRGEGLSPEDVQRLFEPFERLAATNTKKGVGLGLLVCKRLVEAHGGRIWAESTPGQGSTFFFTIPRDKKKEA
jgi:PAS domain S-box-containing protein